MIIYKITSIVNNKVYIGQTITKFANRKGLHLFQLRNNKHPNPHLQSSFNKYGEDNFIFEVILKCSSLEELNNKEKEYIEIYDSLNREKGYNIRIGGLNEILSDEHKENISKSLIGNTNGSFGKGKTKTRPKGIIHSTEAKIKIGNSLKGHKRTKESISKTILSRQRIILQFTLDNIFVSEFNSIKEASLITGISRSQINLCCLGRKRSSKFIFKYKTFNNKNII